MQVMQQHFGARLEHLLGFAGYTGKGHNQRFEVGAGGHLLGAGKATHEDVNAHGLNQFGAFGNVDGGMQLGQQRRCANTLMKIQQMYIQAHAGCASIRGCVRLNEKTAVVARRFFIVRG